MKLNVYSKCVINRDDTQSNRIYIRSHEYIEQKNNLVTYNFRLNHIATEHLRCVYR